MLVITENLICRPPVEVGQRGTALADFQDLIGKAWRGVPTSNPLQAFLGRAPYRRRNGFAGNRGEFTDRFLGRGILDVQGHLAARKKISSYKDSYRGHELQDSLPRYSTVISPVMPAQSWSGQTRWKCPACFGIK